MPTDHHAPFDPQQAVIVTVKGDPGLPSSTPRIELDLARFQTGRWALQLDAVFAHRQDPAVILAQGVACLAVAWWAQLSPRSHLRSIEGALFLSPLHVGFGQEAIAAAARLGPSTRLPFPSVVASAAYPFIDRLLVLADGWGSHFAESIGPGIADAMPTNRHAAPIGECARLIALLPLLTGASCPDDSLPNVDPVIALRPRR